MKYLIVWDHFQGQKITTLFLSQLLILVLLGQQCPQYFQKMLSILLFTSENHMWWLSLYSSDCQYRKHLKICISAMIPVWQPITLSKNFKHSKMSTKQRFAIFLECRNFSNNAFFPSVWDPGLYFCARDFLCLMLKKNHTILYHLLETSNSSLPFIFRHFHISLSAVLSHKPKILCETCL